MNIPIWTIFTVVGNALALLVLAGWMRRFQARKTLPLWQALMLLGPYFLAVLFTWKAWWWFYLLGVAAERCFSYYDRQRLVGGQFLGFVCTPERQALVLARSPAWLSKPPGVGYSLPISWEVAWAELVHGGLQMAVYLLFRLVWSQP